MTTPTDRKPNGRTLRARVPSAAVLAASALVLASAPTLGRAAQVYAESAMVKVQAGAQPKALQPARIAAARNEFEAFQVVVHGGAVGVKALRAEAAALTGPGGAAIPATSISLYRADLLNVTTQSGSIGKTGSWPDPLVPAVDEIDGQSRSAFPFDVAANQARSIWVDVFVPGSTPPGLYRGSVAVRGENFSADVPVELEVWGFDLPSTASLATAFLMYSPLVCQAHTGSTDCGGQAQAAELTAKYERLALDHRLTLTNAYSSSDTDWTAFDTHFGPLLDGTGKTRLPGARMTTAMYSGGQSASEYSAFSKHFTERGWIDRLFDYTADEPPAIAPWSSIAPRATLVASAAPQMDVLVTTTIEDARANGVLQHLEILTPAINFLDDPDAGNTRGQYDAFVAEGNEIWTYQSCMSHGCAYGAPTPGVAWPSYMADVPAMRNRMMQWAAFQQRVTGELYYETVLAYRGNPWSSIYEYSGNGDGTLFYPGTPAQIGGTSQVPVGSIRLKMIREGMEDFEYLNLLATLGQRAEAERIAAQVLPKAYGVVDEPERVASARRELAVKITALLGPPGTPGNTTPAASTPGREEPSAISPSARSVVSCAVAPGAMGAGGGLLGLLGLLGAVAVRRRR